MRHLQLALLITVCGAAEATAQTTNWESLTKGDGSRVLIVVDEGGIETRGRLVFLTLDELTIATDGREQTFSRSRVATVFQSGDSLKNGALIGFGIGAGFGLSADDDEGCWTPQLIVRRQCTTSEIIGFKAVAALMLGGVGAGIGALADRLTPGRRLLYEKPKPTQARVLMAPLLTRSRIGLSMGLSW